MDNLKPLHPFLDFPFANPQIDSCREISATLKFDVCSMFFQTKSSSSTCYSFFVLKLMRETFVAYAISKSSLALSTCSIKNRFL